MESDMTAYVFSGAKVEACKVQCYGCASRRSLRILALKIRMADWLAHLLGSCLHVISSPGTAFPGRQLHVFDSFGLLCGWRAAASLQPHLQHQ